MDAKVAPHKIQFLNAIQNLAVLVPGSVCCSVLQCVAVCCTLLHFVAVCCSVLQCVAV